MREPFEETLSSMQRSLFQLKEPLAELKMKSVTIQRSLVKSGVEVLQRKKARESRDEPLHSKDMLLVQLNGTLLRMKVTPVQAKESSAR